MNKNITNKKKYLKQKQKENQEKNKQLKQQRIDKCFGNCMMEICKDRSNCERYETQSTTKIATGCLQVTNERHGMCNCTYKRYCHVDRQSMHHHGRVGDCFFYQEHLKQDIEEEIVKTTDYKLVKNGDKYEFIEKEEPSCQINN